MGCAEVLRKGGTPSFQKWGCCMEEEPGHVAPVKVSPDEALSWLLLPPTPRSTPWNFKSLSPLPAQDPSMKVETWSFKSLQVSAFAFGGWGEGTLLACWAPLTQRHFSLTLGFCR